MKRTQTGHFNDRLPVAVVILALLLLAASADASSWVDNPLGAFLEAPRPEAGYLASDSPAQTNRRFQLFPEDDPQAHLYDLLSYRYDGHRNFGGRLSFRVDSMHARYYSPNLGRFLSVDPRGGSIGSSQSWNRYSYVENNPIGFVDPNGEALATTTGLALLTLNPPALVGATVGVVAGTILTCVPVYAGNGQTAFEWWREALSTENTSERAIIDDSTGTEDRVDQAVEDHDGTEESDDEIDKRQRNEETMKRAQREWRRDNRASENDEFEGDPNDVLEKGQTVPRLPENITPVDD